MSSKLIPSRSLFVSVALLMAGNGLLSIYLSVHMTLEAFPTPVIGVVMSAYFAGLVTGAFYGDRVIYRVGHIRAFAAFASVATSAVLMHGLFSWAPTWAVLRAVTGFAIAGLYVVIESWLNAHATRANRGRLFSLYMATSILALGLGQFLLNVGHPNTTDPIILAAVLLALCAVPVSLTRAVHPNLPERTTFSLRELFRRAPVAVLGALGAGLTGAAFVTLGPVYGVQSQLGIPGVSALMGVTVLGGLLLQWPMGSLSDHYDRKRMLVAVNFGVALVSLAILLSGTRSIPGLLALATCFGGLTYLLYPLSVSHANDLVDGPFFVQVSAGLLFAWGLGSAIGPLLAASVMAVMGPDGLFLYTMVLSVGLGVLAWTRQEAAVHTYAQSPFVALTRTTPVIAELDPRAGLD
ncbi:MAG: hypothetical protein B7Z66_09110 [Chromatiales bacterium 21-64-14]|nr:MAG: hypothetical protein B7Z66_09110 [Chromatiales bacterium 21-64-14]HQU15268.1 MFS transporter [Gammaproteobacteria bacterium]